MKAKIRAKILENKELAPDIYSLWLDVEDIADEAEAGQFVLLYSKDESRLLPRPISLCEVDRIRRSLRLVYRVVGKGTGEFAALLKDLDRIELLGALGQGFPVKEAGERVLLLGGGIGIPPLLETAKLLKKAGKEVVSVLGYRGRDTFLLSDFERYSEVIIATDDGSLGFKGNVIDAAKASKLGSFTDIYSCGPLQMLKGVKAFGEGLGIKTYLSLEERMACGVGVCLGCVCESSEIDSHSLVKNKRVCKEGPVFLSTEVVIR